MYRPKKVEALFIEYDGLLVESDHPKYFLDEYLQAFVPQIYELWRIHLTHTNAWILPLDLLHEDQIALLESLGGRYVQAEWMKFRVWSYGDDGYYEHRTRSDNYRCLIGFQEYRSWPERYYEVLTIPRPAEDPDR